MQNNPGARHVRIWRVAGTVCSVLMSFALAAGQVHGQPAIQQTTGITLVAADPSGAVIPHAHVQVMQETNKVVASGSTDQNGRFTLTGLSAGPYVIEVSVQGFKTEQTNVNIQKATIANVEVMLPVLGISCPVVVDGIPEVKTPASTPLDAIPFTPLPIERPNFLRRFFGGLFHRLGF